MIATHVLATPPKGVRLKQIGDKENARGNLLTILGSPSDPSEKPVFMNHDVRSMVSDCLGLSFPESTSPANTTICWKDHVIIITNDDATLYEAS